jgi:hypothetical protein
MRDDRERLLDIQEAIGNFDKKFKDVMFSKPAIDLEESTIFAGKSYLHNGI